MKKVPKEKKDVREAAALKYNSATDEAPYIVALGKGNIADRMIESAQERDVQIVKDVNLSHLLNELSVGDEVPEELYAIVAQILVFVSDMDNDYKTRFGI